MKDLLANYLNVFQSIENQITEIPSCVLSSSGCQDPSVLVLSGHAFEKGFLKDLEETNLLLVWHPDSLKSARYLKEHQLDVG